MAVKNTIGMQNNTARHLVLSAHPAGRPWHLKPAVWSPIANHPADITIVHLTKKATINRRREALGLLCWIKWSLFQLNQHVPGPTGKAKRKAQREKLHH